MHCHQRLRALALGGLVALLGACQPGPSASPAPVSVAPTEGAAASPTTGSSPAASTAPTAPVVSTGPSPFTVSLAAAPFLRPGDGPAGSAWVMPAAGTRARDGTLVLVIVWFDAGNEPPKVTISTSADGTTWNVGTTHIFEGLEIGFDDPGPIPSAIVQLDDGSWLLYGWASANAGGSDFITWRTSAPGLDGPWTLDGTELLAPGPAGDWDSFMVGAGSVLRSDTGYSMWFEGEPPGSSSRGDIGLATSADGLAWTKRDDPATTDAPLAASDPVIRTGICGPATSVAVEQPQVEQIGERMVALFAGLGPSTELTDVFGAVSEDGATWRCGSIEPVVQSSDLGEGGGIHTIATIPLADGSIGLIAESIVTDHSELWWATVTVAAE